MQLEDATASFLPFNETFQDVIIHLLSMTELKSNFGLTNVDTFKYTQPGFYLKSFGHQSNLEGILFESEKNVHVIGKPYKTLQRAYSADNLF